MLVKRESGTEYVETLLGGALGGARFSPADRGLAQELVYGVVRWEATLDWLIDRKSRGRRHKHAVQALLRVGLYQLFWLDRVPDHAAVNETVDLARALGCAPQTGFLNAVLRAYVREKAETIQLLAELKQSDPATGLSHPEWLVARWTDRWGDETTRQLLEWNNAPAPVFARRNSLKADSEALTRRWQGEGVEWSAVEVDWAESGLLFQLEKHPSLGEMTSFQDGWFYIQDPSTLMAVNQLDPQPGESILDLCAAPGGKTTCIAARMRNQGRVVAVDSEPERLKLLAQNCGRLGVECVEAHPVESFKPKPASFDRILIDAPCSNTGVMRRRVDLRWRIQPGEILRLADEQMALLRRAKVWLKPGGLLVYSTCSLELEENEARVRALLNEEAGFRLESQRELLPFRDGVDGAFTACLRRTDPAPR